MSEYKKLMCLHNSCVIIQKYNEIYKLRSAIFFTFYNISRPNVVILLIARCSFRSCRDRFHFCLDQKFSQYSLNGLIVYADKVIIGYGKMSFTLKNYQIF